MPSKIIIEIIGRKYSDGIDKEFYFSDSEVTYNSTSYVPVITSGVLFSHSIYKVFYFKN